MRKVPVSQNIREKHPYHRPAFIRKVIGARTEQIEASYDTGTEWCQDPVGYFVIKVFYDDGYVGARFHTNDHVPKYDIIGTDAEEIVQTIVRERLVSSLQHAAYLGHELHKAETALKLRLGFVQDSPLDFSRKTRKKESDNLPE